MDKLFYDWGGSMVHVINESANDGELPTSVKDEKALADVMKYPDLDAMMNDLKVPTEIIGESSFESFNLERRQHFIDRADREGHVLKSTCNRETGRHRRLCGFPKKSDKTDMIDVYVIRHKATETSAHLKAPRIHNPNDPLILKHKAANEDLMRLRRSKTLRISKRSKNGFVMDPDKDLLALKIIKELPLYKSLDEELRFALGNGDKYSKSFVACIYVAAKRSNSRREFENICGLYAHGYPCMIRSDIYMHRWRKGCRAGAKAKNAGKITLSQFRKASRWLYHHTKTLEVK